MANRNTIITLVGVIYAQEQSTPICKVLSYSSTMGPKPKVHYMGQKRILCMHAAAVVVATAVGSNTMQATSAA